MNICTILMYDASVRTSQRTRSVPITGTDTRFMCGETGEVCNESHMKGVSELWG